MSQGADLNALTKLADEVLNGKEFFVGTILARLSEGANALPHDQAVRTAQNVLGNKVTKEGSWATITQMEFQKLYDEVAGLGNKMAFHDLMGDFLYREASAPTAHYNEAFISGSRHTDDMLDIGNPDLVEEFGNLFDNNATVTASFVDNGRKGLEMELAALGVSDPSVEVAAKNQNFVIYAAQADSSYGPVPVLIPAEVKLGHTLMPSVFVSGTEFVDLTTENLVSHAQETASGQRTSPDAPKILEALSAALEDATGVVKSASVEEEFHPEFNLFASSPIYREIDDSPDLFEVETQYADLPPALEHLTEGTIREALIEAGLSFQKEIVAAAKILVGNELYSMGVQANKISIASEFDGGLVVTANIVGKSGQKTIEVPIEVVAGQVLMPNVFTSGVVAKAFDRDSLQSLANDEGEGIFRTAFSDKLGWGYRELHEHALKCASRGNFIESEEALAVINDEFGPEFHKAAFNDLSSLLSLAMTEEQRPMHAMERYVEDAIARAGDQEANIKMSDTMLYLHPED